MADETETTARAVLRALADLAPATEQPQGGRTIPLDWFRWLPAGAVHIFGPDGGPVAADERPSLNSLLAGQGDPALRAVRIDSAWAERLAAVDQIRMGQRSLRVGWLFVAGTVTGDSGRVIRVFQPLVAMPVTVQRGRLFPAQLLPAGDAEITELITDQAIRHRLEGEMEFGGGALYAGSEAAIPAALLNRLDRLHHFARSAAAAAGLPATAVVPAGRGPEEASRSPGLRILAGVGVYAVTQTGASSRASSLRSWADGSLRAWTAFHSMYLDVDGHPPARREEEASGLESPSLLTPTQRRAVLQSRSDRVTVISGAAGTGKSHTIVAIACDALARNESVLVAAKSDDAVDALVQLLERAPGPDPVVFGSHGRREALGKRLEAGQLGAATPEMIAEVKRRLDDAIARRDVVHASVAERLAAEVLAEAGNLDTRAARLAAPRLFEAGSSSDAASQLVALARAPGGGFINKRRRRRARRQLDAFAGSAPTTTLDDIARSLAVAQALERSSDLVASGGLEIGAEWEQLRAAEDEVRLLEGRWLAVECRSTERLSPSTLPAVAALATALRSGRSARRAQLARLDRKVTRALPLWIGSLPDIDDLLPPLAGLFDLVILDEASSIDQTLAVPALLRAERAVIVGDPRQLRHVSFLSDGQINKAVTALGIDQTPLIAARLDVRRNSAFDVATGISTVLTLSEHFRSNPHLVDWVARNLYGSEVQVATKSPIADAKNCIDVRRTDGHRDKDGVVTAEIDEVVSELRALLRNEATSVGVITPFRAQADAIEAAVLAAFTADDLVSMDLRTATVHGFQGNERDVIILSVGVGPEEGPGTWRFVEEAHLLAVMLTRARKCLKILLSAPPPDGGMLSDYLAQAGTPQPDPQSIVSDHPWTAGLAHDLQVAGLPVATNYRTGRHVVDICVGNRREAYALECRVHPLGPDAHIDRHLALRRQGWDILEAYNSKWAHQQGELIVGLVQALHLCFL